MKFISIISALLVLMIKPINAEKTPITAENLWEFQRVGNPVVSPDRKQSVFPISTYYIDENNSKTHLCIMNNETGEYRQLTSNGSESAPAWSPDENTSLLFPAAIITLPNCLFYHCLEGRHKK